MGVYRSQIYSAMFVNYRNGRDTDVFDLMYELSKPYGRIKAELDELIKDGDAEMVDMRTYRLAGDVENRAVEILSASNVTIVDDDDNDKLRAKRVSDESVLHMYRRFFGNNVQEKTDDEEEDEEDEDIDDTDLLADDELDDTDLFADDEDDDDDDDDDDEEEDDDINFDDPHSPSAGTRCAEAAEKFFKSMRPYYSEACKRIIDRVYNTVIIENHNYIASEHLVFGMLMTDCGAGKLLKEAGLDVKEYTNRFLDSYSRQIWAVAFTARTRSIMYHAFVVARTDDHDAKVRSEHLLLATIEAPDTLAYKILNEMGVDLAALSAKLKEVLNIKN